MPSRSGAAQPLSALALAALIRRTVNGRQLAAWLVALLLLFTSATACQMTPEQATAVLRLATWAPGELSAGLCLGLHESDLDTAATNLNTDGSTDFGWLQINGLWTRGVDPVYRWMNPLTGAPLGRFDVSRYRDPLYVAVFGLGIKRTWGYERWATAAICGLLPLDEPEPPKWRDVSWP